MSSSNPQINPKLERLAPAKLTNSQPASEVPAPVAFYAIKALGYARIGLGAASLLAPRFTCGLFKFPTSNETATVVRLFGVRGIGLGDLLIMADDKRQLKRTLWANVGCDMIYICSLGFAVSSGHIGRVPGALLAGGAAVCVGLGLLGLDGI